jgi:Ca2+-binding RTX toxin-like protein
VSGYTARMRRLLPLAVAVALGILASPASAGTVSVVTFDSCEGDVACSKYAGGHPVPVTDFTGAPGEANRVTVAREADAFVIRDAAFALEAKAPCQAVDANTARCPVTTGEGGIPGLQVLAADADDEAVVTGDLRVPVFLSGARGDDVLTGGGEPDEVDGGPGDDRSDGGGGIDTLQYGGRTEPITIDLKTGTGGALGEGDRHARFETAVGGQGHDAMRGGTGDDTLDGGPGNDQISGGDGDDTVFGGIGTDRLVGGDGGDRLFGDPAQGDDYYTDTFAFGDDRLVGSGGDDELYDTGGRNSFKGGPGRDLLEGGEGRDRLDAGSGNDRIDSAGDEARDNLLCGSGRDRFRADRRDRRTACERRWRPD